MNRTEGPEAPGVPDIAVSRIVRLPRVGGEDARSDPFAAARTAAVVAAWHSMDAPVVWSWSRPADGGPVSLLSGPVTVAPPGSESVPAGALAEQIRPFTSWRTLAVRHEGLPSDSDEHRPEPVDGNGPSVESCLLPTWNGPFLLAVVAEPVRTEAVSELLETTAERVQYAQQRADRTRFAVEHERLRAWYRELRRGELTGLWRLRLLVGGRDAASADALAGLAAVSCDLAGLPYVIGCPSGPELEPTIVGSDLVAALCRPPTFEVPGIRLAPVSSFDVTPEVARSVDGVRVSLGTVLDRELRPAGGLELSGDSLNRHTFVCGATGAGKSQTVRHVLEGAARAGVPWLVVEASKAEYRTMATRLPDHEVVVIRPGDPDQPPVGLNPLQPVPGFGLQTHLDLVRALFLASFDAEEPFPQVLAAALTMAYEQQGWSLTLGRPTKSRSRPRWPTLADLQVCAERVVDDIGYGREVADNVRGFIRVRLSSLRLGTTGRFLEGGHRLDLRVLLRRNVVLEIEDVGDDRDKAFLMGNMLIALTEHHRVAVREEPGRPPGLRHLTVVEEAHRLLRQGQAGGAAAEAVEMFAALLAEVRAYGEGLIIADQIPAKLIPDVIKNTAVKVVHRLPARDDRESVGATMQLTDEQSAYLVTVPPGVAAVFYDGMNQPVLVRMPDGTTVERSGASRPAGPAAIAGEEWGRCAARLGPAATLAEHAEAALMLADHPMLAVWVELVTLSHLTGWPAPSPTDERALARLAGLDGALRGWAIGSAVDKAVAARSAGISDGPAPAALAEHVVEAMGRTAFGERSHEEQKDGDQEREEREREEGCADDSGWVAAPFRNAGEEIRLLRQEDTLDRRGRERLETLQRERHTHIASGQMAAVLFGTGPSSTLEQIASCSRIDPRWPDALADLTGGFTGVDWAVRLLAVPAGVTS